MTKDRLVYRHRLWVRITHWVNAICMTVLVMSGLQIFNAHPALHWVRFRVSIRRPSPSAPFLLGRRCRALSGWPWAAVGISSSPGCSSSMPNNTRASGPRSGPVSGRITTNRQFVPRASATALPKGRSGKALQCTAEAHLSRSDMRAVPVHRALGPCNVATARCRLALAARDLGRAAVGPHDPFCVRLRARQLCDGSPADGPGLGRLEQSALHDHGLVRYRRDKWLS